MYWLLITSPHVNSSILNRAWFYYVFLINTAKSASASELCQYPENSLEISKTFFNSSIRFVQFLLKGFS